MNYTVKWRAFPFPWVEYNLQATSTDVELGLVFTVTAPIPRMVIDATSEYSFLHVGSLNLGLPDKFGCATLSLPF